MAKTDGSAASSQTKSGNHGLLTSVLVTPPRKITYVFEAVSLSNLSIPYAVAVDGLILPAYANKPARVGGRNGNFTVTVRQGQRVTLYLNSDAHPDFRCQPVYALTAGERDVIVKIKEKKGKHNDADTPIKQANAPKSDAAVQADTFTAPLTGDIWMKVSHRYTAAEVDGRLPKNTRDSVKAAVKSIYEGLSTSTLSITESPEFGKPKRTLTVTFTDSDNPKENITKYALLTDGLTRVHPGGYAALFEAALESSIVSITLSSCWRPMLGSIAHRAGLGLDVSVVGTTKLNRKELRRAFSGETPSRQGNRDDADNVTDAEVKAFGEYEAAIVERKRADTKVGAARRALKMAERSLDSAQAQTEKARLKDAEDAARDAANAQRDALRNWERERDAGEPASARLFRASLLKCLCVKQLFDPWFTEHDTRDGNDPLPNMQMTSNETLHAHHLHITVNDERIL